MRILWKEIVAQAQNVMYVYETYNIIYSIA